MDLIPNNEKKIAWLSEEAPLELTGFLIEKNLNLAQLEKDKSSFIACVVETPFIQSNKEKLRVIDLPLMVLFKENTSVKELFQVQEDFQKSVSFELPLKAKFIQTYLKALIKNPLLDNRAGVSDKLFQKYKQTIPEKLLIIEDKLSKLDLGFDLTLAEELRSEFHKGAGCAGSFGYKKAGKLLAQMEKKWLDFLQSGEKSEKETNKTLKFLKHKFHDLKEAYQYQN